MKLWLVLCSFVCLLRVQHSLAQSTAPPDNSWHSHDVEHWNSSGEFSFFREEYIPLDYNRYLLPPTKQPVVNISVEVLNMEVDERKQDVTVEMNLRLYWEEPRLSTAAAMVGNDTFMVISTDMMEKLWHPDVFIDRTLSVTRPTILTTPASFRLYRTGVIRYSARLTVDMSCEMDFHFFPGDKQKCRVHFMSYAYPMEILEHGWAPQGAKAGRPFLLPNFEAELEDTSDYITSSSSAGAHYRTLVMTVSLQRKLGHHVSETYVPSAIVVILSWLASLMPDDNHCEKIIGGITLLLADVFLYSGMGDTVPKVSYYTALDIWMLTCIITCFILLVGSMVGLKFKKAAAQLLTDSAAGCNAEKEVNNGKVGPVSSWVFDVAKVKAERLLLIAKTIDWVKLTIIPVLFIVFNVVYWPWLIHGAEPYIKQKYIQ